MEKSHDKLVGLIKAGLVAAIYVVLTVALAPFSYGAVQFRVSEMLNNLAVFNKRYVWALTIGCVIANLWSSLGAVDVVFGSLQTLLMTGLSYFLGRFVNKKWQKLAIAVVICTAMMWMIALELFLISKAPFWATYLTVALGELGSMVLGAVLFGIISTKIDLTK